MEYPKILLIVVLAVVVVGIVIFVGRSTGQAFTFGGGSYSGGSGYQVNAHSCNADDTCEVNQLKVLGNILIQVMMPMLVSIKKGPYLKVKFPADNFNSLIFLKFY